MVHFTVIAPPPTDDFEKVQAARRKSGYFPRASVPVECLAQKEWALCHERGLLSGTFEIVAVDDAGMVG
jgi:hypothetical protein